MPDVYTVIDRKDWLQPFRSDPKRLKVLVLEFLPCASKMALRWTTPQTTQATMDALNIIHRAGIVHDDIHPRNLLVLPEGRVMWIDFELAVTWPHNYYVTTETLHNELRQCWDWLYVHLLCHTCSSFTVLMAHLPGSLPGNGNSCTIRGG